MAVSNFSKAKAIPSKLSTRKSAPTTTNFAKGIYTYKPNDTMGLDEVYLAQNARFDRIGEYKTRRGLKALCEPIGKNVTQSTYGATFGMRETQIATLSITTVDPIYSITVKARASNDTDYGVLEMSLIDTDNNVVAKSCAKNVPTTTTDVEFVFDSAPSGTFTVKLATQGNAPQQFQVGCVSLTTTMMYKLATATAGTVTNIFEANITGTKTILFTFKTSTGTTTLYRMAADGTVTSIRTLPSGVEKVRFQQNINKIRYVDGKEGPRLIDPTDWSDTAIQTIDLKTGTDLNMTLRNILDGSQDNIMYFGGDYDTEAVWTYPYNFEYNNAAIQSYDKFDVDFYQNFPAIETGDPLTAMFNLGGVIYIMTRRNKYYIYYQTADVWNQQTSSAQHGTFSQESIVCDLNYAYYACDDGVYVFDGSSEESLTDKTIQGTYDAIPNKESITLDLYKNRLYVFYSSTGNGINDSCLVFNTNLKLWESFDTGTYVSATCARKTVSNRFLCGSSHYGQLLLFEDKSNDYADQGTPIDFDLETSYMHFGTPSQLHRIVKWRPEFATVDGNYTIKCGYAENFTDDVKYAFSINLHNNTPVYESYVWDNPPDYGNPVTPTKLSTIPQVNGQFYRCQLRYQHHAAFEPVNFKSQTLSVETQRLR